MLVILLNGYPQSGKDTFADIAMNNYGGHKHSTIDACSEFAITMGWDGIKNTKSRKMLSDLKKFYVEHFDGPFRDLTADILWGKRAKLKLFFTFSREGEEIYRIKNWCNENDIPFYYIFVIRGKSGVDYGNDSDNNVYNNSPTPDYICYNHWPTVEDYKKEILMVTKELLESMVKEYK
jgi:hypothetical protein